MTMTLASRRDNNAKSMKVITIGAVTLFSLTFLYIFLGERVIKQLDPAKREVNEKSIAENNNASDHIILCLENGCESQGKIRNEKFGGNLLDPHDLLRLVEKEKTKLITNLKVYYGEYFEDIFYETAPDGSIFFRPIVPITKGGKSWERLKQKLMIKVLEVQTEILKEDKNMNSCSCRDDVAKSGTRRATVINKNTSSDDNMPTIEPSDYRYYTRYVWATGGHSIAAGHGNLYNESYTAYLSRDLKEIFASIGIDFEVRNYAMGGSTSASEISMCWSQIYGNDVDFLVWDFSSLDSKMQHGLTHFGYRAALSPGFPAYLAVRMGQRDRSEREKRLRALEEIGMSVFVEQEESSDAMRAAVPESSGMSVEEIQKLPEYVRNFKCNGALETGDPFCKTEKYSTFLCSPRHQQQNWHPGFKTFALEGHGLALFLLHALLETLNDLIIIQTSNETVKIKYQNPFDVLSNLQREKTELQENLRRKSLPDNDDVKSLSQWFHEESDDNSNFDRSALWKNKSLCRTGRLPAQSRYLGYTTVSEKLGNIAPTGRETYDIGIPLQEADKNPEVMNGTMMLVYDRDEIRERDYDCPVVLKPDHRDYFYAHAKHGPVKLTFPNKAEKAAYKYNPTDFFGLLFIWFGDCFSRYCAEEQANEKGFARGDFTITVNDEPVTKLVPDKSNGLVLKGNSGFYWQPNKNGDYELVFHVKTPGVFVKLSSIVLY